jgi:hypothetical protein
MNFNFTLQDDGDMSSVSDIQNMYPRRKKPNKTKSLVARQIPNFQAIKTQ